MAVLLGASMFVGSGAATNLIALAGVAAAILGVLPGPQKARLLNWTALRPLAAALATFLAGLSVLSYLTSVSDVDARTHVEAHNNVGITTKADASFTVSVPTRRDYLTVVFSVQDSKTDGPRQYCEPSVTLRATLQYGAVRQLLTLEPIAPGKKLSIAIPPSVSRFNLIVRCIVPPEFTNCAEDLTIVSALFHN